MSSAAIAAAVLVVDDDVLVLDFIQSALEDGGFHVETAVSGSEAVALLEQAASPHLALVTDVNLGSEMTGWDVGRAARERAPDISVVYISGDSGHEWSAKGVPKSMMIEKPFAPAQLVTAVATLINEGPLHRAATTASDWGPRAT